MDSLKKSKALRGQIMYTLLTVILLSLVIFAMVRYIYSHSEQEAFEKLHLETQQIRKDINLQMISDRENLITMANFASKLYSDGEGYELMFRSFEEIGLIENIGILTPKNTLITRVGTVGLVHSVTFEEEAAKGAYISGRVDDLTMPSREVVRSAVPIVANGETVGILYGVIELDTLQKKYIDDALAVNAQLYVIEGGNGNFVVDTEHDKLGRVTSLASAAFNDDFSYEKIITDLTEGISGYSSFKTQTSDGYVYVHYSPIGIADWQIMLAKPEKVVFAGATNTGGFLVQMSVIVILIMAAYLLIIFALERRASKMNFTASTIRKRLLELNQQFDSIHYALESITRYAKARSAFFVDTYGEDYNYIVRSQNKKLLRGEAREHFINKIMNYAARRRIEHGVSLFVIKLVADKKLKKEMPEFYEFLKAGDIKNVCFAVVVDSSNNTSILGVINSGSRMLSALLKDIAVCFSIAVYNKKHLTNTEAMAFTDSLTGISNRMAYKHDITCLGMRNAESFACIYIDVNELHYMNLKNGHAAGDQMLVYIAEVLKHEFFDSRLYRMGGDEFLIFTEELSLDMIKERLDRAKALIEEMKYHVSIGIKYGDEKFDIEEMVNSAEKVMYEDKTKYYQYKELKRVSDVSNRKVEVTVTGIKEVDACLSIMSMRYLGAYCVSLKNDTAFQVLSPSYFSIMSDDAPKAFSDLMMQYIHALVEPEYHRSLTGFLNYEILERQLKSGHIPRFAYRRIDGESVVLSVYEIPNQEEEKMDTVWIFEKADS